jgi:hypothetical protein
MNDNCSEEAMCLDTIFGNVNIDELEIEPCYESCGTNMQGEEWYENSSKDGPIIKGDELENEVTTPLSSDEYYEVFPYNNSQCKGLKIIYKSLTLPLQLYEETCSPRPVHPYSLERENKFIYIMPMHRKRV